MNFLKRLFFIPRISFSPRPDPFWYIRSKPEGCDKDYEEIYHQLFAIQFVSNPRITVKHTILVVVLGPILFRLAIGLKSQ